jgi:hypothetical protein
MEQFIASAIVNGNEVQLIKQDNTYSIRWGESSDDARSQTELLTLEGNPVKESDAIKQFLQAAEAAQYLTFSKL